MSFEEETYKEDGLASWVMEKVDRWRDHYESTYKERFEEYYRLWRGQWNAADKTRTSERSQLISPALQQAVESAVAEVEEATFGRGKWFDIQDDARDNQNIDVEVTRKLLDEEFKFTKVRRAISEVLINSAVYGTGCGELVLEEVEDVKPAMQPILDGAAMAVGVMVAPRTVVKLRPV